MKENCLCIKNYISADISSENYSRYRRELMKELKDPFILDKSTLLADDAPLKREAQIIIDAFESVTNGMENMAALSDLEHIGESSVLAPWKFITLAIKAFYNQDYSSMNAFIRNIEKDTPPRRLGLLLLHLSGIKKIPSPEKREKKFIHLIQKDRSIFQSTRNLLEDALSHDMEDLFIETSILLVREIKSKNREAAERIALWSIREGAERDFSQAPFLGNYKLIFGKTVSLRLFALALKPIEPDISILFWLQSLTSRLRRGDASRTEIAAYFHIIAEEIDSAVQEGFMHEAEHDYMDGFNSMVQHVHEECRAYFPNIITKQEGRVSFDLFHAMKREITGKPGGSNSGEMVVQDTARAARRPPLRRKSQPVQLSLF